MKTKRTVAVPRSSAPKNGSRESIEICHENTEDDKYASIAECAYYKAEARGFSPGREMDDWLSAEIEINSL